ncbi:MAG: hypothetical protein IPO31_13670 [Candidatus Obscuribacter sp.]|nr:hypothetical protein [Candidatus Obscuribacter sp.]
MSEQSVTIETGERFDLGTCADCGHQTWCVNGYVYVDSYARAVYYARWTDNHLEHGLQILLSIGQWGEGTTGELRFRVGVECRIVNNGPGFMIVNASDLPWNDEGFLGRALTREEVLSDPIKEEVFFILDHLIIDDDRIDDFLVNGQFS